MNQQILPMRRGPAVHAATMVAPVARQALPAADSEVRQLELQLQQDVEQLFSSVVAHEHASDQLEDELLELVDAVAAARRGRRSRSPRR